MQRRPHDQEWEGDLQDLCQEMTSLFEWFSKKSSQLIQKGMISERQYRTLMALPEDKGLAENAIANGMDRDSGGTGKALKGLEAIKLVSHQRDGTDKRRVLWQLTEAGKRKRGEVYRSVVDLVSECLGEFMTREERRKILGASAS